MHETGGLGVVGVMQLSHEAGLVLHAVHFCLGADWARGGFDLGLGDREDHYSRGKACHATPYNTPWAGTSKCRGVVSLLGKVDRGEGRQAVLKRKEGGMPADGPRSTPRPTTTWP